MQIDISEVAKWFSGLFAGSRFVKTLSEIQYPKWLHIQAFRQVDRSLTDSFLPASEDIEIVVQKGNRQALAEGKPEDLSPYLSYAHSQIDSFYGAQNPSYTRRPQDFLSDAMLVRGQGNILLLGGPIANTGTIRLGGYSKRTYINENGIEVEFPVFEPRNGIALGFFCGDEGYGFRDGVQHMAWRYEKGEARRGAVFSVKNARAKNEFQFSLQKHDGKQFVAEEGLIISRLPHTNPDAKDKSILIVGGAHGFSAEAFARDLTASLSELAKRTRNMRYYQAFVPCKITHDHIAHLTYGTLNWEHPNTTVVELGRDEL